jgi:YD repeat-containing protein
MLYNQLITNIIAMIHSLRQYWLAFLTLCFVNSAAAQSSLPNQELKPQDISLPKTPAADGLYQHSPFPIDHSSGAVNIDIPLYTVKSGRIELPISISYNTGGVRVQDIASEIGLGWNLNFGYNIRVIEDETKMYPYSMKNYKKESEALAANNRGVTWAEELLNYADGYYPSRQTLYEFRCGTYSGTFFYHNTPGGRVKPFTLLSPENDVNITAINFGPTASQTGGFTITTPDGVQYTFDKRETSFRREQSYPGPTPQTTAFWVSKIKDLVSGDIVTFTYADRDPYFTYQSESYSKMYNSVYGNRCPWSFADYTHQDIAFQTNGLQISSIGFTGGHVDFMTAKDRLDIDKTRISGIKIFGESSYYSELKYIRFNQSYFSSSGNIPKYTYRLKLDSMTISPNASIASNNHENTYRFEYDPTPLPAYRERTPAYSERNSLEVDYWGYYNGSYGGDGLIPKDIHQDYITLNTLSGPSNFSTDRKANALYTKACVLNKIVYPTGGYASFIYENHKLPGYYLGATLGGLRVKSIVYSADTSDINPLKKTFNYLSSKELTPASPTMYWYSKAKTNVEIAYNITRCLSQNIIHYISSEPLYSIVYHHGSPVFYDKVEEIEGNAQYNSGKTIYNFLYSGTDNNEYVQSTIKEYGRRKFLFNKEWTRGQLLSKEVYKIDNDYPGSYRLVLKEVNSYKLFSKPEVTFGMMVSKNDNAGGIQHNSWDLVGPEAHNYYVDESHNNRMPVNAFTYNDIFTRTNYYRLSKQETYNYGSDSNVYSYVDYFYDSPIHECLTKTETKDSYGNINTSKYYYVRDASPVSNSNGIEWDPIYGYFSSDNRVNDIIQEDKLINGKIQLRKKAKYFAFNNIKPLLESFSFAYYDAHELVSYTDIIKYLKYDNHSSVLEKQDGEGILSSYIWDDSGINLLASVENAAYSDVFQTSFEYGGKGKWIYSGGWNGVGDSDADAMTGSRSAILSGRQMTASGLSASKEYVVSYWSTNGSYNIPGSTGVTEGRSVSGVNNWKYYEHRLTGVSSVTISGTGKIDEVRLVPKDAQLTSYTHTSVIGVNTICDENGKILYYSYDGLGRLVMIRDLNKNVVKRYCYKFYDQPDSCTESYN